MNIGYHVSPSVNVASIMQNGLVPAIGERSAELGETRPGVYLFPTVDDLNDALGNWLGECFDEDDPLTVFEVDFSGLDYFSEAGFEVCVPVPIEPLRIRIGWEE